MYNFLTQEDNPFPTEHDVPPVQVVCEYAYQGAAFARVDKDWHVDFLVSFGDTLTKCHNMKDGHFDYTIVRADGTVTIG